MFFDDFKISHKLGPIVQTVDYYPFGMVSALHRRDNSLFNAYLYQGKELNEDLGLYDFHARWYNPAIGRFLSVDPAGQFYSGYVGMGNNPVMGVDPTGMYTDYDPPEEDQYADVSVEQIENGELGYVLDNVNVYASPYVHDFFPSQQQSASTGMSLSLIHI